MPANRLGYMNILTYKYGFMYICTGSLFNLQSHDVNAIIKTMQFVIN